MVLGLGGGRKLLQGLGNDVEALLKLLLGDDERRREADDVSVRWLGLKRVVSTMSAAQGGVMKKGARQNKAAVIKCKGV